MLHIFPHELYYTLYVFISSASFWFDVWILHMIMPCIVFGIFFWFGRKKKNEPDNSIQLKKKKAIGGLPSIRVF